VSTGPLPPKQYYGFKKCEIDVIMMIMLYILHVWRFVMKRIRLLVILVLIVALGMSAITYAGPGFVDADGNPIPNIYIEHNNMIIVDTYPCEN